VEAQPQFRDDGQSESLWHVRLQTPVPDGMPDPESVCTQYPVLQSSVVRHSAPKGAGPFGRGSFEHAET
jgi:hypothetical protein